jgi:CheY-like chemotaxis protein
MASCAEGGADCWQKIPISIIDSDFGEQTPRACVKRLGTSTMPASRLSRFSSATSASSHTRTKESNLNYRLGADMSSLRVLVVEDFVPFWQFIRSTLAERPDIQVIGEVADGLEGVQKAELLKPDLVLLDIGLPTLNGIEAAVQIRKRAPESRIIFVSQESSWEMVQEALNLGAWGYVLKERTANDLLAAVKAVLEGRQFVSFGLSIQNFN